MVGMGAGSDSGASRCHRRLDGLEDVAEQSLALAEGHAVNTVPDPCRQEIQLLQEALFRCRFLLKLVQSRYSPTPLLFAESYPGQSMIEFIQLEGAGLIGIQEAVPLIAGCLELSVKGRPLRREHGGIRRDRRSCHHCVP